MDILLSPPVAFLLYIPLVTLITLLGRKLAGPKSKKTNLLKTSIYGGGEVAATGAASPGYRQFFLIAFFFAILHLGMLVLGSGALNLITGVFLAGLMLALIALILG
jgi:NADH:ubiquinone oxidoreductase subunit 3 (subunit A)